MWFLIKSKNKSSKLNEKIVAKKILIQNEECYLIVIGNLFSDLTIFQQKAEISKIISLYSQFSVFIFIDSNISSIIQIKILETLKEYNKKYQHEYEFENSPEFKETSRIVINNFMNKINEFVSIVTGEIIELNEKTINYLMEEKMEIKELVSKTITGSLSYLLIKGGKLVDSQNISAPPEELNRFVISSRLSSVLLNKFPGIHRDLKDQKVAYITLHDKSGEKIILIKQLKENHSLVFECTKSELDDVKQAVKVLDKRLEKGGAKNE